MNLRRWRRAAAAIAALLLSGCYQPPGAGGGDGGPTPDAPDGACESACVSESELVACSGDQPVVCDLGCATVGGPHCRSVVLSNGVGAALVGELGDVAWVDLAVSFAADGRIDATPGGVLRGAGAGVSNGIGFSVIDGMAVYAFSSLQLTRASVSVARGARTVLVASTSLELVDSTVDGRGLGPDSTPVGCGPGGSRGSSAGGGGGAGTAGADGGGNNSLGDGSGGGGLGGLACASMHAPLQAGSSGGLGDATSSDYGRAGAPGAALMLASRGSISVEGSSFWFGGSGGGPAIVNQRAGGGGSGGTVFIEAAEVSVTASQLYANGGNGGRNLGGGAAAGGINGVGPSSNSNDGEGRGGTLNNAPGLGKYNVLLLISTGGGGAVGTLRLHGVSRSLTDVVASPAIVEAEPLVE